MITLKKKNRKRTKTYLPKKEDVVINNNHLLRYQYQSKLIWYDFPNEINNLIKNKVVKENEEISDLELNIDSKINKVKIFKKNDQIYMTKVIPDRNFKKREEQKEDSNRYLFNNKGLSQETVKKCIEMKMKKNISKTIWKIRFLTVQWQLHITPESAKIFGVKIGWYPYEINDMIKIENAFIKNRDNVELKGGQICDIGGLQMIYNFKMEENTYIFNSGWSKNIINKQLLFNIKRVCLTNNYGRTPIKRPLFIAHHNKNNNFTFKLLKNKSIKTDYIKSLFNSDPCLSEYKITDIFKIYNNTTYQKFLDCKNIMGNTCNQTILFHGTKKENIEIICNEGFDPRLSNKHAKYGRGTYFAKLPSKAHLYNVGNNSMIVSKVLIGRFTQGEQYLVRSPKISVNEFYDSVVDDESDPQIFVIFDASQSYTDFVIMYEKKI